MIMWLSTTAMFSAFTGYVFGKFRKPALNTESRSGRLIPKHMTLNDLEWLFHVKFCVCACRSRTSLRNFRKQSRKYEYSHRAYHTISSMSCSLL